MPKKKKTIPSRIKILLAAKKCFANHGYEKTSVDQIAEEASVAKGTIYHHFKSKQHIFSDLLDLLAYRFKETYQAAIKPEDSAKNKLAKAIELLIMGDMESLRFGLLLIYEFTIDESSLAQKMQKNEYHAVLKAIIKEGQKNKEFDKHIVAGEFAGTILILAVSQVFLIAVNGNDYDLKKYHKAVSKFILKGLER